MERNPLQSHRTTAPCSHRISADRCGSNSCGLQPSFHDTLRQLRWASAQQEHHVARGFWNYSECFWREAAAVRAFSVFWRDEKPGGDHLELESPSMAAGVSLFILIYFCVSDYKVHSSFFFSPILPRLQGLGPNLVAFVLYQNKICIFHMED